jgi:hypothetical protein
MVTLASSSRARQLIAALTLLGLTIAGCGGSDSSSKDDAVALLSAGRTAILHSGEPASEARSLAEIRAAGRRAEDDLIEVRVAMKQLDAMRGSNSKRLASAILTAEAKYLRSLRRLESLPRNGLSIWGPVHAQLLQAVATINGAAAGIEAIDHSAAQPLVPASASLARTLRRIDRIVRMAALKQGGSSGGNLARSGAVPSTGNCGSHIVREPDSESFEVTNVTATNKSCDEARSMIESGPSGRMSSGWNCPLTGDKTYTSCTRRSQSVSWNIPSGRSSTPPTSGSSGDCSAFATSGPDGLFTASNIQIRGTSCSEARSMISSGPSGRVRNGWKCPLTGDKSHTDCSRSGQSVSWDLTSS